MPSTLIARKLSGQTDVRERHDLTSAVFLGLGPPARGGAASGRPARCWTEPGHRRARALALGMGAEDALLARTSLHGLLDAIEDRHRGRRCWSTSTSTRWPGGRSRPCPPGVARPVVTYRHLDARDALRLVSARPSWWSPTGCAGPACVPHRSPSSPAVRARGRVVVDDTLAAGVLGRRAAGSGPWGTGGAGTDAWLGAEPGPWWSPPWPRATAPRWRWWRGRARSSTGATATRAHARHRRAASLARRSALPPTRLEERRRGSGPAGRPRPGTWEDSTPAGHPLPGGPPSARAPTPAGPTAARRGGHPLARHRRALHRSARADGVPALRPGRRRGRPPARAPRGRPGEGGVRSRRSSTPTCTSARGTGCTARGTPRAPLSTYLHGPAPPASGVRS